MLRTGSKSIYIFIVLLIFSGCIKEIELHQDFPRLRTYEVSQNSEDGVNFNGEIIAPGISGIQQYGFAWSKLNFPNIEYSDTISRDKIITQGKFSIRINSGLEEGEIFRVCAFAITDDYVTYGNEITFESKGCEAPVITSIYPLSGHAGDTINITGERFSRNIYEVSVNFGNTPGAIISTSKNKISVKVPEDIPERTTICCTIYKQTACSGSEFEFLTLK